MKEQIEERFWSKVNRTENQNECWEWNAASRGNGYGAIKLNKKVIDAHRLSDNIKKLRKLSFTQIKEIYESLNNGISRKELALKYNVSLQVISNIRTKKGILYKKIGLKENQLVDNLT